MNYALIFAGGAGRRMNNQTKPKQFLLLHGKPILLYTLEHFDKHPEVNAITVVCLENWIEELKNFLLRCDIKKVRSIVPGGATGHESIFKGLAAMEIYSRDDDIVLIHDGVRPLIDARLISLNIAKAQQWGAVITVTPALETVVKCCDSETIESVPPRHHMYAAKAPQTFRFRLIYDLYKKAARDGHLTVDSAHLCSLYNLAMHVVLSTPNNIKITAPEDFYIFRALYELIENNKISGRQER
ncbi:MAG: 2-C-methyl-D-erythritol 4-phosphate cytidylyltransferase [Desulfarculales bacterium]|jgi:2-C-methyl-D-erythritol 4-phosphate cytidylyltransferase|nr:2-C-methyl-D-erythritol 4-phosphate cytidylyltransferase [Desulfarculales bacterium]